MSPAAKICGWLTSWRVGFTLTCPSEVTESAPSDDEMNPVLGRGPRVGILSQIESIVWCLARDGTYHKICRKRPSRTSSHLAIFGFQVLESVIEDDVNASLLQACHDLSPPAIGVRVVQQQLFAMDHGDVLILRACQFSLSEQI